MIRKESQCRGYISHRDAVGKAVLDGGWGGRTRLSGAFGIFCLSVFTGLSFPSNLGGKSRLDDQILEKKHDAERDLGAIISIFGEEHHGRPCCHAV